MYVNSKKQEDFVIFAEFKQEFYGVNLVNQE